MEGHYNLERVMTQSHGGDAPVEWPGNLEKMRKKE